MLRLLTPSRFAGGSQRRLPAGFIPSALARLAFRLLAVTATGLIASAQVFAQTVAAPSRPFAAPSVTTTTAPSGIASLGQVTVALGLVLAVIFVAAWLLRRVRGLGRSGTGTLDVIAELAVGQKERAVLIRVGTTQVLIGVAPGRVTTLHVLAEPVSVTPQTAAGGTGGLPGADRPTFKSLLLKGLGK